MQVAPIKSRGEPNKSLGLPIKNEDDAFKIERQALILVWRGII